MLSMFTSLTWNRIPKHCQPGLRDYILKGTPVEEFLEAVLSNDLRRTFEKADDINRNCVIDYVKFLYMDAPGRCWGSPDNYAGWIRCGGLNGLPPVNGEDMNLMDML